MAVFSREGTEKKAEKLLVGAFRSGRVPGAYVFSGGDTSIMSDYAKEFAKLLICGKDDCSCRACSNIEKGTSPDLIRIMPEGKKGVIKIERIRELKERVKLGPSESAFLVAVIIGADKADAAASNSMLKMLEESPGNVLFILVTDREHSLPPTISSRCQKVVFSSEPAAEAEDGGITGRKAHELLSSSTALYEAMDGERDRIGSSLRSMMVRYAASGDARCARIVMDTFKDIKRMANPKISLDRMALKIGGII